jgi:hypothetical protein
MTMRFLIGSLLKVAKSPKQKLPNYYPEHYPSKEKMLRILSDL